MTTLLFSLYVALQLVIPQKTYAVEISPPTAPIQEVVQNDTPVSSPPASITAPLSPEEVITYVTAQAEANGLNPIDILFILSHESQNGQNLVGDDGNSLGFFQISKIWHPEVSVSCSMDLGCSTAWTIKQIKNGHISEWSTYKYCKQLYQDCPF